MGRKKSQAGREYPFHPLAEQYPLMTLVELEALADDIRERGLAQPIVVWNNQIIDGRNRYLACVQNDLPCQFVYYQGNEESLEGYIASLNEHRRHLTPGDRDRIQAARVERLKRVQDARKAGKSLRTIAEEEGVSLGQIQRDLQESPGVSPDTPETPEPEEKPQVDVPEPPKTVTGRDGKTYPATPKKTKPAPDPEPLPGFDDIPEDQAKPKNKKKKAKPQPEKESQPVGDTDELGIVLTGKMIEVFSARANFDGVIRELQGLQQQVNLLAGLPGGSLYALELTSRGKSDSAVKKSCSHISDAIARLKWCRPYSSVCPYCHEEGKIDPRCIACHGQGWVNKKAFEKATPERQEAVKALARREDAA